MDELNLKRDAVVALATGVVAGIFGNPTVAQWMGNIPYAGSVLGVPLLAAAIAAFGAMLILDANNIYKL